MTHDEQQILLDKANEELGKANYDTAERLITEVLAALNDQDKTVKSQSLRANSLHVLAEIQRRRGNNATALDFAEQSLTIAHEFHLPKINSKVWNTIGIVHSNLGNYDNALEYFAKTLDTNEELGNRSGVASVTGNMGIIHWNLGNYHKALEYMTNAVIIHEELGNKSDIVIYTGNIGLAHHELGNYDKALEYFGKTLGMCEELRDKSSIARVTGNIGNVYLELGNYEKALEYYAKALNAYEVLGEKSGVTNVLENIGSLHFNLGNYEKALEYYTKALTMYEASGDKSGAANTIGNIGVVYASTQFPGFNPDNAEDCLRKAIAINTEIGAKHMQSYFSKILSELYEHEKRYEEALAYFRNHVGIEKEINIEEVKKQESIREQQTAIEIERTRATAEKKILSNILPEEITQRLIKGENPIADHFECVSILFMDIVDFTPLSTKISVQQLVHLLNAIFTAADGVMREFGLEKIKTIGDAYMAVAGAPIIQADHAPRAAQAAVKLIDVMKNLTITFPENYGDRSWIKSIPEINVRIGMHCGSVAAGVVGENKFLYDLWGDAVNTASRMESHGEAGKIHCSEDFVNALNKEFYNLIERGELEIKGKGKMKTYFIDKIN